MEFFVSLESDDCDVCDILMAHGGRIFTVVTQAATNRVAPVLPSSDSTRYNSKLYHLSITN